MSRKNQRPIYPFIPRAEIDRVFAECLHQARKGKPTFLIVLGEPGSGKSSLLDQWQLSPLVAGRNVALARIGLAGATDSDPVSLAHRILLHPELYERVGGRRRAREIFGTVLPDWISAVPFLGDLAGAIITTIQAILRRRKKADAQARLPEDIAALHHHATRRPVAVFIDDLHEISEAAADRLLRLVRDASPMTRLLVVGAATTPRPGTTRSLDRALLDRLSVERLERRELPPLSRDDTEKLLQERVVGPPLPFELVDLCYAEGGGQPGATIDLVSRFIDSGALRLGEGVWTLDEAHADSLVDEPEAEAEAHLGLLPAHTAEAVRIATVFGDEFDASALARLLEIDELDLEDRLSVAVRYGILAVVGETALPDDDISTRYRFVSVGVRASLHRSLAAARRRELTARAIALA